MVANRSLIFLLILTLSALACKLPADSNSPKVDLATQTNPTPIIAPALTAQQIRNAQYKLGARDDHPTVQLIDGKYQQGADTTTIDYAMIFMADFIAVHDFTGDGFDDAIAIVFENYGGTGNFAFLTFFVNQNNTPVFLTSTMIDDRPLINDLSIEDNHILLDVTIHGVNDSSCCPALRTNQWYRLADTSLQLAKYTSFTPLNTLREIEITTPQIGDSSSSIHLTGNITIAPFENTLSYRVTDLLGTELTVGPISVAASDFGAPGTFDVMIDLSTIPSGSTIFLEIRDISAADGSVLAMDSVLLTVK